MNIHCGATYMNLGDVKVGQQPPPLAKSPVSKRPQNTVSPTRTPPRTPTTPTPTKSPTGTPTGMRSTPTRTPPRTPSKPSTSPMTPSPALSPQKRIPTRTVPTKTPPINSVFTKTVSTANSCTPSTTTTSNTVTPVSTDGISAMTVNYEDEVTPPESFFESSTDSPKIVIFIRFCSYIVFILSSFMLTLWALAALASLHIVELSFFEDKFMEYG